ncbi:hypothetical protein GW17_00053879 [Ensete ventricosum]|uniref:Uncharacterized protein n=1 Tax=Ensete ventricosum TaxID=4639 RepID=A0A427B5I4_ENSVE|nr:hypothetical protein B296_00009846 [Ensete ventricosum]RWV84404.1 hypothetical protein GW17_00053879 [Ensete ventricosum]
MDSGEITASKAVGLHFLCVVGLAAGYGIARVGCDLSLVTDPARTLRLLLVRHNPPFAFFVGFTGRSKWDDAFFLCFCWRGQYWKAVSRGLLGLPIGEFLSPREDFVRLIWALLNAFGAIVLGAPVGLKYWLSTIYWSSLMSLFTEWPICVTYGAIAGYSVGMFASAVFVQLLRRKVHVKDD